MTQTLRTPLLVPVACLLLTAGACSGTKISQQMAPDLEGASFKKIVVMGLFDSDSDRKTFEDGMVRALEGAGCEASGRARALGPRRRPRAR